MINYTEALGLDVGEKRIGVARVGSVARLPEPITTLDYQQEPQLAVMELAHEYASDVIVVGLPRSLSGEETQQTLFSRRFADTLVESGLDVVFQDEAMTSRQAEGLIKDGVYKRNARGKDVTVDEVAACLILQDFAEGEVR